MNRKMRIAVVGAGLGGMTVAGFLQREGFDVAIYEQAHCFVRLGAGITLSPNVTKVLRRLGIEDDLIKAGVTPNRYMSRAWNTGEIIHEFVFDSATDEGVDGAFVTLHRGDLHAVLAKGVSPSTIAFDHRLVRLEDMGHAIRLFFENGATADTDLVIGADGIRSKVREYLLGIEPPQFAGAVAYRSVFPTDRLGGFKIPDHTKWWGPGSHLVCYFVRSERDEVNVMAAVPSAAWEWENASRPSSAEEMMAVFDGSHDDLRRVLRGVGDVNVWPIYDRERNDKWSGGRVVLLGDACHAMRPYMGAGGASAIEDAAILSRCLAHYRDLSEALNVYEATRIPRVGEVQRISMENSWLRGPTETDWYYCYDACTAPLKAA